MRNKIYIRESSGEADSLLLPKFIYKAISSKNTSLGDNDAFPKRSDVPYEYSLIKKMFSDSCNDLLELGIDNLDVDYLSNELSSLIAECKDEERPIRDQLTKICENTINTMFGIPKETLIITLELKDKVNVSLRVTPDEGTTYEFEDDVDLSDYSSELMKRRFIDSLIQGASDVMMNADDKWRNDISSINPLLVKLYDRILAINNYLLYARKDKISERNPMQAADVLVKVGSSGTKSEIHAEGIIFPFLLKESIRGLFEMFSAHGLPDDKGRAMSIIRQADFILAEPWDARFGKGLFDEIFGKYVEYTDAIPYMFTELVSMETNEFNEVVRNVLAHTKKGNSVMNSLFKYVMADEDYNDFKPQGDVLDGSRGVISDEVDADYTLEEKTPHIANECFTADELDKLTLNEEEEIETCNAAMLENADEDDISFEFEMINGMMYATVLCNGCRFSKKDGINLIAEPKFRIGENMYQLHISLDESLRQKGIATKLYKAFITTCGDIVSLYSNRVGTYAKENNKSISLDSSIDKIFQHLAELPNVSLEKLNDASGKEIGICAIYST